MWINILCKEIVKTESEKPQVIVRQNTKINKPYDSRNSTKFIPLNEYSVSRLTNFLDLDITDILTKDDLKKLISKGVNVIVR